MQQINGPSRFFLFLTIAFLIFSAENPAIAKDVSGRFGLGLDNTLSASTLGVGGNIPSSPNSENAPTMGLSLKYWINNDWAIASVIGFAYADPAATKEVYNDPEGFWAFAMDFKTIYNFSHGDMANMGLFMNFHMRKESTTIHRPEGPFHTNLGLALSFGFTPEVFLTDDFALCAELGLTWRFQEGMAIGISGDNLLGGFGFHYYF